MKKSILVALFVTMFALAGDTFADGVRKFWFGTPVSTVLNVQYDKYVKYEPSDSTGALWTPITSELIPDGFFVVRFNSFEDPKIPPLFEWRIYTRLPPKPPIATDPNVQQKCAGCHGGFGPPSGGAKAPAKEPEKSSGGAGSEKSSGGAGSEKSSGGAGSEKASGGMGSDDPPKADPSSPKGDKSGAKELKKLSASLAKGVNPWCVGEQIAGVDPEVWGEVYKGGTIALNDFYTTPLEGDTNKKRDPPWILFEPCRKMKDGVQVGPTLVRTLLLRNKK